MRSLGRLKRLERLRPRSFYGFKQVIVNVPQPDFERPGTLCSEHADCKVRPFGPIEAHFQLEQPPLGSVP